MYNYTELLTWNWVYKKSKISLVKDNCQLPIKSNHYNQLRVLNYGYIKEKKKKKSWEMSNYRRSQMFIHFQWDIYKKNWFIALIRIFLKKIINQWSVNGKVVSILFLF